MVKVKVVVVKVVERRQRRTQRLHPLRRTQQNLRIL
jgi:hypothetical protein